MTNTRALLISLIVSTLAVLMLFSYVSNKEKALLEMVTPIQVLVATKDIPEGVRIDDSMFEVAEIPQKYIQPGAINDPTRILDRHIDTPVLKGTQILETMFVTSEGAGISTKIPKNKRAFSVFMTDVTAVGDLIQPGDMVDLMLTVETGTIQDGVGVTEEMITKTVLQNILVLAVNQTSTKRKRIKTGSGIQEADGSVFTASIKSAAIGEKDEIKTLTVALSPKEVQVLNLSQEIGTISAALRSSWDEGKIEITTPLSSRELLGIKKNVIPRSRPAWVEIRGSEMMHRFGN